MFLFHDSRTERNVPNSQPSITNNDTKLPPIPSAAAGHHFSTLTEHASDAIEIANEQGAILSCNVQTVKLCAYENEEPHGQYLEASIADRCWQTLPNADHPTKILVVEDNPVDVRMLRHILQQETTWATEMEVVQDGEAAIHYLTRQNSFTDAVKPDLIILDLNLPKRDGTEVLQMIRSTQDLKHLPVFVFSSSPEDVIQKRVQSASVVGDRYVTKPIAAKDLLALGGILHRAFQEVINTRDTR